MSLQNIYNIRKDMQKWHKKFQLLDKKQKAFGLSAEEEIKLKTVRIEWNISREELIESHMETSVFPLILIKEAKDAIKQIQKIIPWTGRYVMRDKDLQAILDVGKDLTQEQREFIEERLTYVHRLVLQKFESFCLTDEGWSYMNDASKVLTNSSNGDIMEIVIYLDSRYREFGEILDIDLDEIKIYFDGDDDKWKKD